jgi:restriction system protein
MKNMWMVRAGRGAEFIDDFIEKSIVAIGWIELGNIEPSVSRDKLAALSKVAWPAMNKSQIAISVGQMYRFLNEFQIGDNVVTYDPGRRVYHVGEIMSDYKYAPAVLEELPRLRQVKWLGEVLRDSIGPTTKNTLGALSTLFLLSDDAANEMTARLRGETTVVDVEPEDEAVVTSDIAEDLRAKSREFIKDRISQLDWQEMQELVAGLLRAMGYKTRISPTGPDRGKDIIASPDGFGFESPRIVVEVKHRPNEAMNAQAIRSFLGGRHKDDKGLYVSTGGFSKDARYEAERASIPVVLLDLDDLVKAILRHYEQMDMEARSLILLTHIYWPV